MPIEALALVLVAACIHATWNYWVKRAQVSGVSLVWASSTVTAVLYAPIALWFFGAQLLQFGPAQWLAVVASGVLHTGYFLSLQRGYAAADLSVVYPVARGTGPLLASIAAIIWFGEPPTPGSLAGLALIVSGTFTIAGGWALFRRIGTERARRGLAWGALIGVFIATYTINDARAVKLLAVAPLLFDWLAGLLRAIFLLPLALRQRVALRRDLVSSWRYMFGVGVLAPLGYILVLTAMQIAPVSRVAPAREVSMLLAAFLGARMLGEGGLRRRLIGAALIAGGVVSLTVW